MGFSLSDSKQTNKGREMAPTQLRDGTPTNDYADAYLIDTIIASREELRVVGPLIIGSTYDPTRKLLGPIGFVHMDNLAFGHPMIEIEVIGNEAHYIYRGTAIVSDGLNIIMPYTVEEIEQLLTNWNPS